MGWMIILTHAWVFLTSRENNNNIAKKYPVESKTRSLSGLHLKTGFNFGTLHHFPLWLVLESL